MGSGSSKDGGVDDPLTVVPESGCGDPAPAGGGSLEKVVGPPAA